MPHSDLKKRFGQVERTKSKEVIGEKRKESQYKQTKTHDVIFPILVRLEHEPLSWADTVGSLQKLNLKLKYIIINIIGDYKGSLINLN